MQQFTLVIRHKSSIANRVIDALSRRYSLLVDVRVVVPGFDTFADLYASDPYFGSILSAVLAGSRTNFVLSDFSLHLCIPSCSLRLTLILGPHNAGHVGRDRTIEQLQCCYFLSSLQRDMGRFVGCYCICQHAIGLATNAGLYRLLPIP